MDSGKRPPVGLSQAPSGLKPTSSVALKGSAPPVRASLGRISLRRQDGALLLSATADFGYGDYDTTRTITVGATPGSATGSLGEFDAGAHCGPPTNCRSIDSICSQASILHRSTSVQ